MKKLLLCAAVASAFVGMHAYADEPKPETDSTFNIAAASEYRYRGISQSRMQPALQGGWDYTNNVHGYYVGTWLSTINWTKDAGGGGEYEWDMYAGKRGEFGDGMSYDVGMLAYLYPGSGLDTVPGFAAAYTNELYAQIGMGPVYVKYSRSITNLFAYPDSRGSGYLDIGANLEMSDGYTLNLHVGHQSVRNTGPASYSDWKIGVTKEVNGVNLSLALIGTNANKAVYYTPEGKFTGKSSLVLTAVKTF